MNTSKEVLMTKQYLIEEAIRRGLMRAIKNRRNKWRRDRILKKLGRKTRRSRRAFPGFKNAAADALDSMM